MSRPFTLQRLPAPRSPRRATELFHPPAAKADLHWPSGPGGRDVLVSHYWSKWTSLSGAPREASPVRWLQRGGSFQEDLRLAGRAHSARPSQQGSDRTAVSQREAVSHLPQALRPAKHRVLWLEESAALLAAGWTRARTVPTGPTALPALRQPTLGLPGSPGGKRLGDVLCGFLQNGSKGGACPTPGGRGEGCGSLGLERDRRREAPADPVGWAREGGRGVSPEGRQRCLLPGSRGPTRVALLQPWARGCCRVSPGRGSRGGAGYRPPRVRGPALCSASFPRCSAPQLSLPGAPLETLPPPPAQVKDE